jgi:hypothetical protein
MRVAALWERNDAGVTLNRVVQSVADDVGFGERSVVWLIGDAEELTECVRAILAEGDRERCLWVAAATLRGGRAESLADRWRTRLLPRAEDLADCVTLSLEMSDYSPGGHRERIYGDLAAFASTEVADAVTALLGTRTAVGVIGDPRPQSPASSRAALATATVDSWTHAAPSLHLQHAHTALFRELVLNLEAHELLVTAVAPEFLPNGLALTGDSRILLASQVLDLVPDADTDNAARSLYTGGHWPR